MKRTQAPFLFFLSLLFLLVGCPVEEDTVDVPGPTDRFDPVESLEAVRNYAGEDMFLESMTATYVRPDGTLNLQADYKPNVTYVFFGKGKPTQPANQERKPDVPLGVRQTNAPREQAPYREEVAISVQNPHWLYYQLNGEDTSTWHAGMSRHVVGRIENQDVYMEREAELRTQKPLLDLALIWQKAISLGAPRENVVAIIAFADGIYRFTINGTAFDYLFDADGNTVE